jgi:hypothetical protein
MLLPCPKCSTLRRAARSELMLALTFCTCPLDWGPIATLAARGALQNGVHLLANRLADLVCLVDALGENAHLCTLGMKYFLLP